jgi:hypothetical protein
LTGGYICRLLDDLDQMLATVLVDGEMLLFLGSSSGGQRVRDPGWMRS